MRRCGEMGEQALYPPKCNLDLTLRCESEAGLLGVTFHLPRTKSLPPLSPLRDLLLTKFGHAVSN
jgi:hypothetical protein